MASDRFDSDRSFSGDRKAAWEGFLHSQARMMQRLGRELDQAGMIPLNTYDILVQLAENGGRLRLRDLVDRVVLSQPGLSRKVARLADEGLLERLPDPHDGRGVLVRLTRAGREALRSAAVVHISGVEREFTSQISDEEASTLAKVFARLLDAGRQADSGTDSRVGRAPDLDPEVHGTSVDGDGAIKRQGTARRLPRDRTPAGDDHLG